MMTTTVQAAKHGSGRFGQFQLQEESDIMAFVNEYISDADKARIDFGKIKHPIQGYPIIPSQWTIDRERDIALIYLERGREDAPNIFVMYWQGQVIDVHLFGSVTGNFTSNDLEVTWRLSKFGTPPNVSRDELLSALKEALNVFGYVSGDFRDKVKAVHFEF